jgi:Flp pilus assembly protein TadG
MRHGTFRTAGVGRPNSVFRCYRCLAESRRDDGEKGSVLVEFVLVFPIFALMLFGMVQFGLVFNAWTSLRNSAANGARLGAVNEVTDGDSTFDCTPPSKGDPFNFTCPSNCPEGVEADTDTQDFGTADLLCYVTDVVGQPSGTTGPVLFGLLVQGNIVTVCSQTGAEPFTGFFPSMTLASTGTFYIEVQGQGELSNYDSIHWPVVITTGTNDTLNYSLNGAAPESLTIAAGTYLTPAALASSVITYSADLPDVTLAATPDSQGVMLETVTPGANVYLQLTGGDAASTLGFEPGTFPGGVFVNDFLQTYNPDGISACGPETT